MLTEAPMVHDWLSANLAATGGAQVREDYERSARVVGSPAPLRPDVLDARQAISDTLTEYVDDLCQRHDLRGPDHHTVQADSAYLLTWLDRIEAFEWVGDWWEHLAQLMTDAHALAPWRPEMRRCHGIPCPECGRTTLVIFGGDEDVTCLSCRTLVPPDRYAIWTRIAADEWSEGA